MSSDGAAADQVPTEMPGEGQAGASRRHDLGDEVARVAQGIEASQKLLVALGDESRQHIIVTMMGMGDCSGVRAVEVAERTNLSRPAVSHHLQIMKDAGLLKTRKEGTKVFYYFDPDMRAMATLIDTLRLAVQITRELPDRNGEE